MTALANWLRQQLQERSLTQQTAAVHAGVSVATVNQILNKNHIPRPEILFRLADYFRVPREDALRAAAEMPLSNQPPDPEEYLIAELLHAFRQIPDEWKPDALSQVQLLARITNLPSARYVGEDQE